MLGAIFAPELLGENTALPPSLKMIENLTFLSNVMNCLNPYNEDNSDRVARPRQTVVDYSRMETRRYRLRSYMVHMKGPQRVVKSQTEITLFFIQVARFEVKFLLIWYPFGNILKQQIRTTILRNCFTLYTQFVGLCGGDHEVYAGEHIKEQS